MSHYANYMFALAEREAQRRGQRDPRAATDLYLPGWDTRMRTANMLLRTARTREAIANILQPLLDALDAARRKAAVRGDTGREQAASVAWPASNAVREVSRESPMSKPLNA